MRGADFANNYKHLVLRAAQYRYLNIFLCPSAGQARHRNKFLKGPIYAHQAGPE